METIIQYTTLEVALQNAPSDDTQIRVVFPSKKSVQLIPFHKGNHRWYVRFSSPEIGKISLSVNGKITYYSVKKYSGNNPLYKHGPIQKQKNQPYLIHADGTPFFFLADTWWYSMTKRMTFASLRTLLKDRKRKGFSVVFCVIGGTPEVPLFSDAAANTGGLCFLANGDINPAYFDEIDRKISAITEMGIVPCLFGSWGYHIDEVGVEGMKKLWKEIIARYSSYPVLFSLTGEADIWTEGMPNQQLVHSSLPYIRSIGRYIKRIMTKSTRVYSIGLKKRIKKWDDVAVWLKAQDPYHRVLMVHPHRKITASALFHNPDWLDIDSIQTGHSEESRTFMIEELYRSHHLPFINLEPWYEGIRNNFGPAHQRYAFWASLLSGACGHTYGAHGVWNMADSDQFMSHWGDVDWNTAYKQKGSEQIGAAKNFLTTLPWWKLKPAREIISYKGSTELKYQPLCGVIENTYCILYIPSVTAVTDLQIAFPNHSSRHLKKIWYDPQSMNMVKSQKVLRHDGILLISAYE